MRKVRAISGACGAGLLVDVCSGWKFLLVRVLFTFQSSDHLHAYIYMNKQTKYQVMVNLVLVRASMSCANSRSACLPSHAIFPPSLSCKSELNSLLFGGNQISTINDLHFGAIAARYSWRTSGLFEELPTNGGTPWLQCHCTTVLIRDIMTQYAMSRAWVRRPVWIWWTTGLLTKAADDETTKRQNDDDSEQYCLKSLLTYGSVDRDQETDKSEW